MNVDLPQAAQNKGRGRGAAGRGGAKAGLGQKMGEQIFFFQNSQKISLFDNMSFGNIVTNYL